MNILRWLFEFVQRLLSKQTSPNPGTQKEDRQVIVEDRYDSLFQYYGQVYQIDWRHLKAQARAESALDPDASSRVGAKGLTQFMDKTFQEWWDGTPGIQVVPTGKHPDPFNPEQAIVAQAGMMAWLLKQTGIDWQLAWAAYNWGIGNLRDLMTAKKTRNYAYLEPYLPSETRNYVARIGNFLATP